MGRNRRIAAASAGSVVAISSFMNSTIAVIVPTFRRAPYLISTLKALLQQTRAPDEIVVIDQTPSSDYTSEEARSLDELIKSHGIILVRYSRPLVYEARNQAILHSKSDILLYLDDDIRFAECLVEKHIRNYADDNIHAIVGQVLPTDPKKLADLRPQTSDLTKLSRESQAFSAERGILSERLNRVAFMWAGNFSIRRSVVEKLGGWDEHVITYGDKDMGLRLVKAGYRLDYDPEALIHHYAAPIGGTRITDPRSPWTGWLRCVSAWYLAIRHLKGIAFVQHGAYTAARRSILLKQNVVRPWRWPAEAFAFIKAYFVARAWAKDGVKSPFTSVTDRA